VLAHRPCDLVERRVGLDGEGLLGHRLLHGHLLGVDVAERLDEVKVALGQHPDELAAGEDRQVTKMVLAHHPVRDRERLVGSDRARGGRHVFLDRRDGLAHADAARHRPFQRRPPGVRGRVSRGASRRVQRVRAGAPVARTPGRVLGDASRSAVDGAVLALVGCAASPCPPPLAAALAHDGRCPRADGGIGLALAGRCIPVELAAGDPGDPPLGARDPWVVAAIRRRGCFTDSNVIAGDGAMFVHATCGARGEVPGHLFRVERDVALRRVAIPTTSGARLTYLPAARPRLVVVLRLGGTMVFDARTLDGLAGWRDVGGWGNARSFGASVSPGGEWLAIPEPYQGRLVVVRLADLVAVASLHFTRHDALKSGPGRVEWSGGGLRVLTYPLPFE
jgi:hypothetical protein